MKLKTHTRILYVTNEKSSTFLRGRGPDLPWGTGPPGALRGSYCPTSGPFVRYCLLCSAYECLYRFMRPVKCRLLALVYLSHENEGKHCRHYLCVSLDIPLSSILGWSKDPLTRYLASKVLSDMAFYESRARRLYQ